MNTDSATFSRWPRIFSCAFVLLACLAGQSAHSQTRVVYPAPESAHDSRHLDLVEMLRTALEKTVHRYGPFTLSPSKDVMTPLQELYSLKHGERINVLWSATSNEMEDELLPVRIPLRKGLLGFRVCLIARGTQAALDTVRTIEDIRKFKVGQGTGWKDAKVYEANGMDVVSADYESLFKMIVGGRFDLFPRGIGEIYPEYDERAAEEPELAVEKNLLIHYPWPYYFFFNKKDSALAGRIEEGIRIMLHDGSFDAIFNKYNKDAISRADLKHRRVLRLVNPLLPGDTPLDDPRLWFTP